MQKPPPPRRPLGRVLVVAALLVAAVLASRGISDEGAVSLQGDMPRHLMNGVFMRDFLLHPSWTLDGALTYAKQYFARYPALSLGHHPPLLPLILVPFYAVFGVSVFAARVAVMSCFVLATWLLYVLTRRLYDNTAAGWAALLFASSPAMVLYGQEVLSEMLAVMLALGALVVLMRFRDLGKLRDYLMFIGLVAASLAAKQLAVFMLPAYLVLLLAGDGWRRLTTRSVRLWTVAGVVLMVPVVAATLFLSPFNVDVVRDVLNRGLGLETWRETVAFIVNEHLSPSLVYAVSAGLFTSILMRDRQVWLGVVWVAAVISGVLFITGPWEVPRYSIYAVPGYCLLGAAAGARAKGPRAVAASVLLALVVAMQLWTAAAVRPVGAGGYEAAAEAVLADTSAPTVLYSASVDTGFFVFFVRKHDPAQRLVVLRSDKLLTTSFMGELSVADHIKKPADIYPLLDRFGTKYVVIEDRPSTSIVLNWLRDEVKGERFTERRRIPIVTTDRRLRNVDLAIYEYRDAKPADPDAEVELDIPLVRRDIRVRLSDLARPPAR